jgi:hypothetical protein
VRSATEELIFARYEHICPWLAAVLRRSVPQRRACEAGHMRIAAPALLLLTAGGGLSRFRGNDDAAVDVLVVQVRAVRAVSRSLPEPATGTALIMIPAQSRGVL